MSEITAIIPYSSCVALRKDGRPCQAVGTIVDSARNGLVCDAHRTDGPGSDRLKRGRKLQSLQFWAQAHTEEERRREALALSLSDDGLNALLNDLRKFHHGKCLKAKTRKILEDILTENNQRKSAGAGK